MNSRPRLSFHPNWKLSLACALLLPLLIGLGFWQLARAEEKEALLLAFNQRQAEPPIALSQLLATEGATGYRQVILQGQYDNAHSWLLDNRVYQGRVGFEVLSPFKLDDGSLLLINRGWIAGDPARRLLPVVEPVNGVQQLLGRVQPQRDAPFRLGADVEAAVWPRVIQAVDSEAVAHELGRTVSSLMIWLDESSAGALQPNWQVINISPAKHTAYAVQWFAMAAALVVMYLIASSNVMAWFTARR